MPEDVTTAAEFAALEQRVAALEGAEPEPDPDPDPEPDPDVDVVLSGPIPDRYVVPAGEVHEIQMGGTVEIPANVAVLGTLRALGSGDPASPTTLRFVDVDEAAMVGGGMDEILEDTGLWVMEGGVLDIQGTPRTGWTRLAPGDPPPSDWQPGDTLLVCPNAPGATSPDDFTVTDLAGLDAALPDPFILPDGSTIPTEVANLTRDVVIEGTEGGRAHILIRSTQPQAIRHATVRHMGPRQDSGEDTAEGDLFKGVLGRYPLHFHMAGDGSRGSVVEGVVARDSGHRAFVPHASHGITMRDCVAHDVTDSAFWWDVRDETDDTMWDRCLAAFVRCEPTFRGGRLAGFLLGAGTGNTVRDSAACGIQGNTDAAGFAWPEVSIHQPVAWGFSDNVSHNNEVHGSFAWQNDTEEHLVDRFVIYRCREAGFDHGAYINGYQYRDFQVAECRVGIIWHALSFNTSDEKPPLRDDGYSLAFDGGVFVDCDIGIDVDHHNVAAQPVLFKDIEFRNVPVKILADDTKSDPTLGDFVHCGLEPDDVDHRGLVAGSLLRFQRADGTAWQMDDAGTVTEIDAFYPPGGS